MRWRIGLPATVAVTALLLFAPGIWWGIPHATAPDRVQAWGVDDETPLGPLAELHNIVDPKPDRNLGYPLGYSFVVAAAYAPYLGYVRLTGGLGTPSPEYPFGLADPVRVLATLTRIAHLVTLLFAVGTVVALYLATATMWDRETALVAAGIGAVAYPMAYYARTGNVDVPMLCFVAIAVAVYARALTNGLTTGTAIGLGLAAGVALGIKESATGALLAIPPALAFESWRRAGGRASAFPWRATLFGCVAAVLALGLTSGLFVDPARYLAHLEFLRGRVDVLAQDGIVVQGGHARTLAGHAHLAGEMLRHLREALTLPALLLVGIGVVLSARTDRRTIALVYPPLAYLLFLFVTIRVSQLRYLLPAAVLLAPFAARAVIGGIRSGRTGVRWGAAVVGVVVVGVGLLRWADLTHAMILDSRFAAGAWLESRLEPGDRIEYFGSSQKLPPLPADVMVTAANEFHGMYRRAPIDSARAALIVARWRDEQPEFVVVIPDYTSAPGEPYDNSMPPALYEALIEGRTEYRLAALFQTPPLVRWARRPPLDYPSVNPPIRVFRRTETGAPAGGD